MVTLDIHVSVAVIITAGFVVLLVGFWLVERSQEKLARNRRKTWSPDVDQQKAETVRNHSPGGMNR